MNKDLKQIRMFLGIGGIPNQISHTWVEGEDGLSPEEAYIQTTSHGIKQGKVNNIEKLNELFTAKCFRDWQKKIWTENLKEGLLTVEELLEITEEDKNDYTDLVFDCMKDIVKTTDRMQELERLQQRMNGSGYLSRVAIPNRNWFMDKLNVKLPIDAHDCYSCKEIFWKHGTYVKK